MGLPYANHRHRKVADSSTGLVFAMYNIGSVAAVFFTGPVNDYFGRRWGMFVGALVIIIGTCVQAPCQTRQQFLAGRFVLGFGVSFCCVSAPCYVSEMAHPMWRGTITGLYNCTWYIGSIIASWVVYGVSFLDRPDAWRIPVWCQMITSGVVVLGALWLPESPRWLMLHGRTGEARAIIDRYLGGEEHMAEADYDSDVRNDAGWRQLFAPGLRSRTFFVSTFYICVVTPYFAIFTFAPKVFESLRLNEMAGTIFANSIAFIGAIAGMLTIERIGRRKQLIGPFWIMAVALLTIGLWAGAPPMALVGAFAVFAFFNALTGNLTAVYPIEVFPTDVRATGVGIANAFSRIGAAGGTFLLPVGIEAIGLPWCMVIGAAMCVVGAVVSQVLAPETTGKSLSHTGLVVALAPRVAPA